MLSRDQVWTAIDAHRQRLIALLEDLTEDEWARPSLCDGWTVRDVAAHLTLQHIGFSTGLSEMIRARGNTDLMIHNAACRRAQLPTAELIGRLRAMAGSRRHPPGVSYLESLADYLLHSLDIAIPLKRDITIPVDAATTAADRMWRLPEPFLARKSVAKAFPQTIVMRDYRLAATDASWTVGTGPVVSGPVEALMLVMAGRLVALPRLGGDGAPALAARLC